MPQLHCDNNMPQRKMKGSLFQEFKIGFQEYLRATTVHGFRYLVDARNICEPALWGVVITCSMVATWWMIYHNVLDCYNDPILTSVQTTEIQKVLLKK